MKKEKTNIPKIIITAGGTAGHIYPALSIIEYIKSHFADARILFIGTTSKMEKELAGSLDIEFKAIKSSGFSFTSSYLKKFLIYSRFFLNLFSGFFNSIFIISSFKPGLILGMGGYVCAPVFIAAILMRKKIAIHEQNFIPGRLNKYFARYAEYIFVSFEKSGKLFNIRRDKKEKAIIHSGNPVRKAIKNHSFVKPDYGKWGLEEKRRTIIAFGGSLGAAKLNYSVISLYDLLRNDSSIQILLICGERFFKELDNDLSKIYRSTDKLIFRVFPFVSQMEELYRIADLVISRAGATTIAELDYVKIPAILIPYPEAIEDHQFYNASCLAEKETAIIIRDADLNAEILSEKIKNILSGKLLNKSTGKEGPDIDKKSAEEIISEKILGII